MTSQVRVVVSHCDNFGAALSRLEIKITIIRDLDNT